MSAVTDPLWAELAAGRRSDVFHSPDWAGVLADTYGFDTRARILVSAGTPAAGMVLVTVDDHLGTRHVSLPFSDFTDPLVDSTDQVELLLGDLLDREHPVTIKTLFDVHAASCRGLETVGRTAWHRIDLRRDPDEMWSSLDASARRAVRKAEAAGVSVRPAESLTDLRRFFELHLGVRKAKYRLLTQPWSFFEAIWRRFLEPGRGVLLLGEIAGEAVSGVLFLEWKDTLYYKFNASAPAALGARPNDAVLWHGMCRAHEHGLAWMDLGVSDLDQPGLIRYKRKYAGEEREMTILRKQGEVPAGAVEARRLLTDLTAMLVADDVPAAVTERGGDRLYRYFV